MCSDITGDNRRVSDNLAVQSGNQCASNPNRRPLIGLSQRGQYGSNGKCAVMGSIPGIPAGIPPLKWRQLTLTRALVTPSLSLIYVRPFSIFRTTSPSPSIRPADFGFICSSTLIQLMASGY